MGKNTMSVKIIAEIANAHQGNYKKALKLGLAAYWANADAVRYHFGRLLHTHMDFPDSGAYVFHCLRHSFATWQLAQGCPPIDLMSILGHANLQTTLIYAKPTDDGKRNSMNKLEF